MRTDHVIGKRQLRAPVPGSRRTGPVGCSPARQWWNWRTENLCHLLHRIRLSGEDYAAEDHAAFRCWPRLQEYVK